MDGKLPVVVDTGSSTTKSGFAGEKLPSSVVETNGGTFQLIERGLITNWEEIENFWENVLKSISINPQEHALLLTEPPQNRISDREKMAQIAFEKLGTPFLYLGNQGALSFHTIGRSTGISIESGAQISTAVPIYNGNVVRGATLSLEIGGDDLDTYLSQLLKEKGISLDGPTIQQIKEKHAAVYINGISVEADYQLPDGKIIHLGDELHKCTEPLFSPSMLGLEGDGLGATIYNAAMKCSIEFRDELYRCMAIFGGTSLLPNFPQRIRTEISDLVYVGIPIKVISQPERNLLPGLVVLCLLVCQLSLSIVYPKCITKRQA